MGQKALLKAIADKLRSDTGAGSLVELTKHDASDPNKYRIARQKPVKKADTPFLGISIFQSVPVSDDGVSHQQRARVHFRRFGAKELTAIEIADRMDTLLHAKTEQAAAPTGKTGTNVGYLDFSNTSISNQQTRWKNRDEPDFDDDDDVWIVLVEADLIWVDEPCS